MESGLRYRIQMIFGGTKIAEPIRSAGLNRNGNEARLERHCADVGVRGGRFARSVAAVYTSAVGFLLILVLVLRGTPTFAQAASPGAQGSPASDATPHAQASPAFVAVEEIVVTAQKREQLSQDVPIALTAITAANIQFRGIDQLSDLQLQVPGLQFGEDTGPGQQIYIRGIGVDDASASIEAPIATYIDGVYQTRTFRAPTLGIDLERIEVLKGPQGTLFGRNATGGAINIILEPPSDDLTGTVKMGMGSYGQYLAQGVASGPLIKHMLDLRVAAAVSRDDGWVLNLVNNRTVNDHLEGDGRVALSFHPLDTLSVDYDLFLSKMVGGGAAAMTTNILMGTPAMQLAAGFPEVIPRKDYINGNNPWKAKLNGPFQGDMENTQNALTTKWDFAPWASLKSITAFQEHTIDKVNGDYDGTSYPILYAGRHADDKALSQEFNLTGSHQLFNWGNWTWLAGAYYMGERYQIAFDPIHLFNGILTSSARGNEKLNDYSVFGDTTIPLPWNFSVFGGVRYTYDKKRLRQTVGLRLDTNGPFLHTPGSTCYGIKFADQFHNVSPRYGIGWAPSDSVNFYVKESFGYNSGGHYFNGCANGYDAETLDTVEGGVKGRWFDGRLTAEVSGYWNRFNNFQVFRLEALTSTVVNAPKAEMYGGEFQVTGLPTEHLTVNLGLSLMHSEYQGFTDTDVANPKAGPQDLTGRQIERAPNHTESVGLEYSWPVPWGRVLSESTRRLLNLGPLRVRGEWYHTDYIIFQPFEGGYGGANDRQSGYSIFNAYATLPTEDGKWELRFFAKNFTNTKYYGYKIGTAWGQRWGVGGMPPWFGGDLTYHF